MATETERKYLIRMPSVSALCAIEGATDSEITQTYLSSREGVSERVRERRYGDRVIYTHTRKKRKTLLSEEEDERTVKREEYLSLLEGADPSRHPIRKRRITFPYGGHLMEVDVFPFWKKQALLEIELEDEADIPDLPPCLDILREVTGDARYKNAVLARCIPQEDEE